MTFLVAAVLIVAIIAATIAYTVRTLRFTPARIATVIVAIIGLVIALPKAFDALQPQAQPPVTVPANPNTVPAVK
ncbi:MULTISPECIES: hypothetical protein [unclassified Streptomyces]|uniref:hypothetical protein n=1 Tax=Streptomyces sp. NPDC059567 TaxID=3346867 RepID=UPI0036842C28